MGIDVRAMAIKETGAIIAYFDGATPEHLAMLGVDPHDCLLQSRGTVSPRTEGNLAIPLTHGTPNWIAEMSSRAVGEQRAEDTSLGAGADAISSRCPPGFIASMVRPARLR